MNQKTHFVIRVLQLVFSLGSIIREVRDLVAVYTDRGYQTGGADPLTDADLDITTPDGTHLVLTVVKFNEIAGVLTQLLRFADNLSVTTGDYEGTINKYRTDV